MDENSLATKQIELTPIEARVLGALMEKQLTTPDAYPLTLNSLVLACNQKTSREPVTQYQPGEVQACVNTLREKGLVQVDYGSRADRFDQRLTRTLGFEVPAQAVLCIMLLRGSQTAGELFNRTQRMHEFSNTEEITELLQHLCEKSSPVIKHIAKQAGQREDRYMPLLGGDKYLGESAESVIRSTPVDVSVHDNDRLSVLEQKVVSLEETIQHLQNQIKHLHDELGVQG